MISGPPAPAGTGATYGPPAPASADTEPGDALRGWRRLLRTLGRDIPAANATLNDAARRLSRTR